VEKGKQVAMMGDVCANSALVLACIGAHDETSRLLMEVLPELSADVNHNYNFGNGEEDKQAYVLNLDENTLSNMNEWMEPFASRPHWSRLWVSQGIFEGHYDRIPILCGDSVLECADLEPFVNVLQEILGHYGTAVDDQLISRRAFLALGVSCITHVIITIGNKIYAWGLDMLVDVLAKFECEDPRDRIYGALRLFDLPGGMAPVVPDYTISAMGLAARMSHFCSSFSGLENLLLAERSTKTQ
jgi:hypothetical protein